MDGLRISDIARELGLAKSTAAGTCAGCELKAPRHTSGVAPLLPTLGGSAVRVSELCDTTRGFPALPHTTPHSLRRTYISIALLANNFDVLWVMR
jgi:hypothetical protein